MTTQTQRLPLDGLPVDVIDLIVTAAIKYQVFQLAPGTVRSTRIITAAAQQLGVMLHTFGDRHGLQDYQFREVTTPVDFRDVLAACQLAEEVHQNQPGWATSTSAAVVRNIARAAERRIPGYETLAPVWTRPVGVLVAYFPGRWRPSLEIAAIRWAENVDALASCWEDHHMVLVAWDQVEVVASLPPRPRVWAVAPESARRGMAELLAKPRPGLEGVLMWPHAESWLQETLLS